MRPDADCVSRVVPENMHFFNAGDNIGNPVTWADPNRTAGIERNPFNSEPGYRFDPAPDYQHDMQLLTSQPGSLQEIKASLGNNDIA